MENVLNTSNRIWKAMEEKNELVFFELEIGRAHV